MELWRELTEEEAAAYREWARWQWAQWQRDGHEPHINRTWHPVVRAEMVALQVAELVADMGDGGAALLGPVVAQLEQMATEDGNDAAAQLLARVLAAEEG